MTEEKKIKRPLTEEQIQDIKNKIQSVRDEIWKRYSTEAQISEYITGIIQTQIQTILWNAMGFSTRWSRPEIDQNMFPGTPVGQAVNKYIRDKLADKVVEIMDAHYTKWEAKALKSFAAQVEKSLEWQIDRTVREQADKAVKKIAERLTLETHELEALADHEKMLKDMAKETVYKG